jgi:hypothetical protein
MSFEKAAPRVSCGSCVGSCLGELFTCLGNVWYIVTLTTGDFDIRFHGEDHHLALQQVQFDIRFHWEDHHLALQQVQFLAETFLVISFWGFSMAFHATGRMKRDRL